MDPFETTARDGLRLQASREKASGKGVFPRIPENSPAWERFEPILLSSKATLYSFTVIHPNPKTGLKPFTLVYADFPEDVRVFGKLDLAEGERVRIGAELRVMAAPNAGYLFEVVEETHEH
jgi:uncharacterized OB-fold protein